MQIRKWTFWFIYIAMAQSVHGEEREENVDHVRHWCGSNMADMLSKYCSKYYHHRTRRQITEECCNGTKGCSIRMAMNGYCREVKPEHIHLFERPIETTTTQMPILNRQRKIVVKTTPKSVSEEISKEASRENKIVKQVPVRIANPPNSCKHYLHSPLLINRMHTARRVCKCRRTRRRRKPHQPIWYTDDMSSESYVGTDHIPNNRPVHVVTSNRQFLGRSHKPI